MHEKRNFILVLLLGTACIWSAWAWWFTPSQGITFIRIFSVLVMLALGVWLAYALTLEDQLPDQLSELVGTQYFETDGVCFFPVIRNAEAGPELSIYYQNRFENPASVIVHLKPIGDSFVVIPNATDIHIAFTVGGGDVGIIHQPIFVPDLIKGEIVELHMAAASHYSRSHGGKMRRNEGRACGTMQVDWAGNAMRVGAHEVDGTVTIKQPATLHLAMPKKCSSSPSNRRLWRQEILSTPN